jgi:hypothetical protein
MGLRWLQKVFIPLTNSRTLGQYRLLILDGHGSHLTPQFDQICSENKIIPICMPAHSSHLLQPLDIGCFAVLKRSYGSLVDQKMRLSVNHIDKLDFLAAYPQARIDAFKPDTIRNSFKAAGLVPLNPEAVLDKLNIQLRTLTPVPERPSSRSSIYYPTTPANIAQLTKHTISAKTLLKYRSESPPTPTKQVVDQAYKALRQVMTELLFTKQENKGLRAELEKKKKKRRRSNRQIPHDGGLSVQEACELIQTSEPIPQAPAALSALPADIWNFDETGFAMGVTSSQYIICSAEYHGKRKVLQAGNREWVTVVEAINAEGGILPPYLIFKGKIFLERWFPLPPDWAINLSPNGWTSDQIGLDWLQKHFIPHSTRKGTYILLILDGHSSHLTPQFDKWCEENKIICLCMPAHASHLLQPLDVGCFSILKKAYGGLIREEMRNGVNSIDKDDFLQIYSIARKATFKASTIQNSFRGAGLVPLDANHVLEKLNICVESVSSLLPDHFLRPTSSSSASDLDTLWSLFKGSKNKFHDQKRTRIFIRSYDVTFKTANPSVA